MLGRSAFTAIVVFALAPSFCVAGAGEWVTNKATRSIQLTESSRGIDGQFSPDGRSVAFLELVKQFTPEAKHYFRARVHVWDGVTDRVVATVPPDKPWERPMPPDHYVSGSGSDVTWFPSARYLWVRPHLVRLADGDVTKAGREGDWFVLNDAWTLSREDQTTLKYIVHGRRLLGSEDINTGTWIPNDGLPAVVPRHSQDWTYARFRASPVDRTRALYIGFDRHFDGCACTRGAQRTYLGVANMETGTLVRLTHGEQHRIPEWSAKWSPDGKWIAYYRTELTTGIASPKWRHLHVVRADDASVDWWVAGNCTSHPYYWLSPTEMLVPLGCGDEPDKPLCPIHLATVEIPRGPLTTITAGPYRHSVCDIRGRRFLVCERDLSGQESQGNLYVIEPL